MTMDSTIDKEKSMEVLVERLIIMVGKSNERVEHLHRRIQQLEYSLHKDSKPPEKTSLIS